MKKWTVPIRQKITLDKFKNLFYEQNKTIQEIANFFQCHISSVSSFRQRYNLPVRGWANGHPFKGKIHSAETRERISKNRKGVTAKEKNPNWKGGKSIASSGYKVIRVPDNTPNSYRGYMKEHRYVMQQHIGRPLRNNEDIHHIDRDKLNNDISNLIIISSSNHAKLHYPKGSKFGIHAQPKSQQH